MGGGIVAMAFGAFLLILWQKYDQANKKKIKKAEKKGTERAYGGQQASPEIMALVKSMTELTEAMKTQVEKSTTDKS